MLGKPRIARTASTAPDRRGSAPDASVRDAVGGIVLSVIVPVHNDADHLSECLSALRAAAQADAAIEIIVVDDASTDDPAAVAKALGVRCVRLPVNRGPAIARNHGVRVGSGEILLFVDADVLLAPDAIGRIIATFGSRPDIEAVIGSYDAAPRAGGLVSQYRNLLHHFVHQTADAEAQTFWTGCGAIRRAAFEAVGGFDQGRFARGLEDVELGYRLRRAGYRILLDKQLQGTHLKRWTLASMIATDVFRRAVPWSRLIVEHGRFLDDLNVRPDQRLSVLLTGMAEGCLLLSPARPAFLALSGIMVLAVIGLNRALFAFFCRQRGIAFATACVPLHLLYFTYGGISFACVWIASRARRLRWRAVLRAPSRAGHPE